MPVALTNISSITPVTSPLAVNGSLNLVGTAPVPAFQVNGAPLITGIGIQHAGTAVATQPAVNFTDTATATFTVANDAANNRVNVHVTAIAAGALADPTTTLGDLIVRGAAAPPTRLGIGTNGQILTADSGQTLGLHWHTLDAAGINLNPNINSWGSVQNAVSNISSTIATLARGLSYVGHLNATTGVATFVPSMSSLDGILPAANAAGIDAGDFLVVTVAGNNPMPLNVGDQIISEGPTGGTAWDRLPIGANMAQVTAATVNLAPQLGAWVTVQNALTDLHATGHPAGAVNQIQWNAGGTPNAFGASANLTWDNANTRLHVGAGTATYTLEAAGDCNITGLVPAPHYRINGIPFANAADATHVNLTNILNINGTAFTHSQWTTVVSVGISYTTGNVGIGKAPVAAYRVDIDGDLNISGDFSIGGIVFAEAGSVNMRATSLQGIDGEPLKLILTDGTELSLDAVIARLEALETAVKN